MPVLFSLLLVPSAIGLFVAFWMRGRERPADPWRKLLIPVLLGLLGAGATVALDWSGHRSNLNDIALFGLPLVLFLGFLLIARPRPSTVLFSYVVIASVHFLIRNVWESGPGDQGVGALGAIIFYFGALGGSVIVLLGVLLDKMIDRD